MAHCKNGHEPIVWDAQKSGKDCPACAYARKAVEQFAWKLDNLCKVTGKNIGPLDISLVLKIAVADQEPKKQGAVK